MFVALWLLADIIADVMIDTLGAASPLPDAVDPVALHQHLVKQFTLDEIRTLCFELGIDFDVLPGEGKESKARELVIYCRNRAMLEQLAQRTRMARPPLDRASATFSPVAASAREVTPAQWLYNLVQTFNKNRHQPYTIQRTIAGDDIVFHMRELAPQLDGQFDVADWLQSDNIGKRVAALQFLDWKQDIEFFAPLLDRLMKEKPFVQFYVLIALNSMLDQLDSGQMKMLRSVMAGYSTMGDASRAMWTDELQRRITEWFQHRH